MSLEKLNVIEQTIGGYKVELDSGQRFVAELAVEVDEQRLMLVQRTGEVRIPFLVSADLATREKIRGLSAINQRLTPIENEIGAKI